MAALRRYKLNRLNCEQPSIVMYWYITDEISHDGGLKY